MRFTIIGRAFVHVQSDARTPEEALRDWAKWQAHHRSQRVGRRGTVTMLGEEPTVLDDKLQPVAVQKTLRVGA